jgi:hypothetical protein
MATERRRDVPGAGRDSVKMGSHDRDAGHGDCQCRHRDSEQAVWVTGTVTRDPGRHAGGPGTVGSGGGGGGGGGR